MAALTTYEVSVQTTANTLNSTACEIVAGTGRPMSILEMGIFLNAATLSTLLLGRPGNTPAGGTVQTATLPITLGVSVGASAGGIVVSGQTTAPTAPAAGHSLRQIAIPAVAGNGIVWNWEEGEMVVSPIRSSGLILWNVTAGSTLRVYLKWTE